MNKKYIVIVSLLTSLVLMGSCKPKQSAYKSVYEAAKEKEMDAKLEEPASTPVKPSAPIKDIETSAPAEAPVTVRKEKLTPASEADASNLKGYSVVVAAMALKPSAESLKERLEKDGYKVIMARNEHGMYRVIIASSDTKEEAIKKKGELLSRFASEGDFGTLKMKYGIPFNDWWILQREY